jgi:signal transduction histidine kinase
LATTVSTHPAALDASLSAVERWALDADEHRHARERRVARDLVDLSRLDRGLERAEHAPVELARLIGAIAADHPQLNVTGPRSAVIQSDSRRLARIIFALVENAQMHGTAPVTLSYTTEAISVADEGPGFSAELLERASEPFVIGDRTRRRGVGLGLAVVERQARLIGADLSLANAPSGGAIATVRLRDGAPSSGD